MLFGEQLPGEAISAAFAAANAADVMLVIGSSLLVTPVSTLPDIVLRHGGSLAILTESDTPYDAHCAVRLRGKAGVQMAEVLTALDELAAAATPEDDQPVMSTRSTSPSGICKKRVPSA